MKILFLLLWFIVPEINARLDKNGPKRNYLQVNTIRGIVAFFHWCLFVSEPDQYMTLIWLIVFQLTSFWLYFEIRLNLLRDNPILYYDTVERDSGIIDRFFADQAWYWHPIAKLAALVMMIYAIIQAL